MLSKIKEILKEHKHGLTLYEIALILKVDENALEKMIEIWINKEKIKKTIFNKDNLKCKACSVANCNESKNIHYKWLAI